MNDLHKSALLFAHRGASGYEYENSQKSFRKGLQLGADGLETDCWLLKDKKNIIIHHDRVLKLPGDNQQYSLLRMSLNDIKSFNLPNGDKILTLREFFDIFSQEKTIKKEKVKFSIDLQDLKVGNHIIPLLREYDLFHRVYLCSDSIICLNRVRKESKEVLLVVSNMPDLLTPESLESDGKIGRLNVSAFNIRARDYLPKFQKIIENQELKTFIWDMQTEDQIKKYLKFFPDAFYSDFPDIAVKIRDQITK